PVGRPVRRQALADPGDLAAGEGHVHHTVEILRRIDDASAPEDEIECHVLGSLRRGGARQAGATDPVAGSNAIVRRPSGAVAGEMAHLRKRPLPAAPTNSPASATGSPRNSGVSGQPLARLPSAGVASWISEWLMVTSLSGSQIARSASAPTAIVPLRG